MVISLPSANEVLKRYVPVTVSSEVVEALKEPFKIREKGRERLIQRITPSVSTMNHIFSAIVDMREYITLFIRQCNQDTSEEAIIQMAESITREIVQEFAQESIFLPKRKNDLSEEDREKLKEWLEGILYCY